MSHPVRARRFVSVPLRLALALAALTTSVVPAQGRVWVVDVDAQPGFDFTDVQPAVNAAADGNVVLVRGRLGKSYGGFTVRAKSLTIAGELDTSSPLPVLAPPVVGPIRIRDVAAGGTVVLRGLVSTVAAPSLEPALLVDDASGRVHVEETSLSRTGSALGMPVVPSALRVLDADALVLARCAVLGQSGASVLNPGQGAFLGDSRPFLHDTVVEGGAGTPAFFSGPGTVLPAAPGGVGATLTGSFLFAAGSRIEGGAGGLGLEDAAFDCYASADGGTGLQLLASTQVPGAVVLDTALVGGAGGAAPGVNCPGGVDGAPLVQLAGSVTTVPGTGRSFYASSPVREDEPGFLQLRGDPGDAAFLLVGAPGAPVLAPAQGGVLHLGVVLAVLPLGAVGVGGTLELSFTAEELGPGVELAELLLQPAFLTGAPGVVLGDPSTLLLLDRSL